jgi:hypothetical protein
MLSDLEVELLDDALGHLRMAEQRIETLGLDMDNASHFTLHLSFVKGKLLEIHPSPESWWDA